ncbi:MAG TPA: hypothetical protein VFL75_10310 [Candidatus Limnocylindria bacterium]|nr:hypothetical protein [Candidatus Limnocylindria bacterium]
MPTPKPGQIRCPTCHRPTPMAAFCTQCGAAIPSSTQARPRGMDRQELDARIRQRRPGEGRLRRGTPPDDAAASASGYVPFEPAPEDARAMRESTEPIGRVDNTAPDFDRAPVVPPPPPPVDDRAGFAADDESWEAAADDGDQYAEPDEGYPYDEAGDAEPRRGGSNLLPVIGFVVLAILALAVGAGLAGILGSGGVAETSATPTASQSVPGSTAPSLEPTSSGAEASSTPEPTDGPVAFPDGAEITVQPCATKAMDFDGCKVDGSTISQPTMWVWIGFKKAAGNDTFTLDLVSDGQTVDQQEQELGSIVSCPGTCSGYLIGAAYRDLDSGDYQLIVRRNGDFADSATFTVNR